MPELFSADIRTCPVKIIMKHCDTASFDVIWQRLNPSHDRCNSIPDTKFQRKNNSYRINNLHRVSINQSANGRIKINAPKLFE